MADEVYSIFSGLGGALQTFRTAMIIIFITLFVCSVVGVFVFRRMQKKRFNIPLLIITPRSDGRVVEINNGFGGFFRSGGIGGITSFRIKRKGIKIAEIPPPPSSYITSPNRLLLLAQKGIDDYEPISPSQLNFVTLPDGSVVPILKLKAINQDATAWGFDNEESAKKRFTFISLWDKYQSVITMMTFVFILFLILYINWVGMKDVIAAVRDLIIAVKEGGGVCSTAPIISQGG